MARPQASRSTSGNALISTLITCWIAILVLGGGASRIDVLGQTLVRGAGWIILLICVLFLPRPDWRAHAVLGGLLLAVVALVAMQLVPLPPSLWTALPGREDFAELAAILGDDAIWRPLSISPGWTVNALGSLVIAAVTFVLVSGFSRHQHQRLMTLVLVAALISSLVGLLQFSGANFDNPLVNDVEGGVSGLFANRNHFALLLAVGCAIVPVWAFGENRISWKRLLTSGSLLVVFLPMILASGSRAGVVLGALGFALGLLIVHKPLVDALRSLPKPARIGVVAGGILLMGGLLFSSFLFGRAKSLERAIEIGATDIVRTDAYATVLEMVARYFPAGTGFGTFDPAYRIAEPAEALRPEYLNQAHNDLLQLALEGGLPAMLLMAFAAGWGLWKSWRAWRRSEGGKLARLGSVVLLLILLASAVDYPARTPLIMALVVVGAIWLNAPARTSTREQSTRD